MTNLKNLLKEKAKSLEPTVRIGKKGITDSTIQEIKKQLEKRKLVKIKFLRNFIADKDRKQVSQELVNQTDAELIDTVGLIVVLKKRK